MYRFLISFTILFTLFLSANTFASDLQKELIESIDNNDLMKTKEIIKKGADINKPDGYGYTSLIWAASTGNNEIIQLLLSKGAEINFVNKDGGSALWYAVTNQKADALKLLLEKGADPNIKFMEFQSPLEYAKERNTDQFIELADILTKAGAK